MALFSFQNVFTLAAWSFFLVQLGSLAYNAVYHLDMSTVITTEQLFPAAFPLTTFPLTTFPLTTFPLTLQVCVRPDWTKTS